MDSDDDASEADANEEEFSESSESDVPSMSMSLPSNTATIPESDNFEWELRPVSSVQPHDPSKPHDLFASVTPIKSTALPESLPQPVVEKLPTFEPAAAPIARPRKTINLFDDEPPELDTISVASKRKSPVNLFLDDDDDIVPPVTAQRTANRPIRAASPQRQKPIQTDTPSTTIPKKTVNLFDDDDYDSFMNVLDDQQAAKTKPATKSTMASIFDDEPSDDLFDVLIAKRSAKQQQPKSGPLFGDDDFAEENKMLPDNNVDSFLSSNRLLKEDASVEDIDPPPVLKPLTSKNIFDDDSDGSDYDKLFGGNTSRRVVDKPVEDAFLSSNRLLQEDVPVPPKAPITTNLFDADVSDYDHLFGGTASRAVNENKSSDTVDKVAVTQQRRLFYDDFSNEAYSDSLFGKVGQPETVKDSSSKAVIPPVDEKIDSQKSHLEPPPDKLTAAAPLSIDKPKETAKVYDEPNIDYDKLFPKVNKRIDVKKNTPPPPVTQRKMFDDDDWTNEHDDLFGKLSSKTSDITHNRAPTKRSITSNQAPSTFRSFLDNDPLMPDDPISTIDSSFAGPFAASEQSSATVTQSTKKDEIDRSAAHESPIKNRLETLFAKAADITGSEADKPKPKKLVHNLNINVGALLPGANRATKTIAVPSDDIADTESASREEQAPPIEEPADGDFVTPPPNENLGNRLIGLTKSRAKFSGQRKLSTRRGRQEQFRKSALLLDDEPEPPNTDPPSMIDEPKSSPTTTIKSPTIAESLADDWLKVAAANSPPDLFSNFLDAPPPLDDWSDNPPAEPNNAPTFSVPTPSIPYFPNDSTGGAGTYHADDEDDLLFGGPPPLHSIIHDDKLFDSPFDTINSSFIEDDWQPSTKLESKPKTAATITSHVNLFSDDDDGDDFFAVKLKPSSTEVVPIEQNSGVSAKIDVNKSLSFLDSASEDEADLFGEGTDNIATSPIINRVKEKIKSGIGTKSGRLFDDDSDDGNDVDGDALFSSKREWVFSFSC